MINRHPNFLVGIESGPVNSNHIIQAIVNAGKIIRLDLS